MCEHAARRHYSAAQPPVLKGLPSGSAIAAPYREEITDQIRAELTDGVLKVSVLVSEAKKEVRQVPVQTAAGGTKAA
jgi:hypothetical protein